VSVIEAAGRNTKTMFGVKSRSGQPCYEYRTNPRHHSSFMQKRETWPLWSLEISGNCV